MAVCDGGRTSNVKLVPGLLFLAAFPRFATCTCRLPITFPADAEPSGVTVGPQNQLVVVSDAGPILFVDLSDFSVRQDTGLNDRYRDAYGWFDLEGIAMTNPESTFIYAGMENMAAVIEYEWHTSHRIFRKFSLPGFERSGNHGLESLTWVPTEASHHQGYFYAGSQMTGHVFIYELPLLDETGPEGRAKLIDVWTPLPGSQDVAGLSYSGGYIFVSYDNGNSNRVLIFPVLESGLPGRMKEQYELDVRDAEGMAVRKTGPETWEAFFTSDTERGVFAYNFHFVTGFELHKQCRSVAPVTSSSEGGGFWSSLFGSGSGSGDQSTADGVATLRV